MCSRTVTAAAKEQHKGARLIRHSWHSLPANHENNLERTQVAE